MPKSKKAIAAELELLTIKAKQIYTYKKAFYQVLYVSHPTRANVEYLVTYQQVYVDGTPVLPKVSFWRYFDDFKQKFTLIRS